MREPVQVVGQRHEIDVPVVDIEALESGAHRRQTLQVQLLPEVAAAQVRAT